MNTKHVTSLEISKQLAEAGIVIESEFVWVLDTRKRKPASIHLDGTAVTVITSGYVTKYPAPIATELLEIMPDGCRYGVNLVKLMNGYGVELTDYTQMPYKRLEFIQDKNPCDALALLLIRLTKDGLI